MTHDHYVFMVQELDALRIGLDQLHAERDRLAAENARLTRERAEVVAIADERGAENDRLTASLHAVLSEREQLRSDLAGTRERLSYHMRLASERFCATCN